MTIRTDTFLGSNMRDEKKPMPSKIEDLIGEEVSSICFVMDYVEIEFQLGTILRSLTNPIIKDGSGQSLIYPESGFRDALCSTIGNDVTDLKLEDRKSLWLRFSNEVELAIPLDNASRRGPEAVHVKFRNGMHVW